MAKDRLSFDPDEAAEWDSYSGDILDAIKSGYLDDHLKELGRASIERAKKVGLIKPKSKRIRTDDSVNDSVGVSVSVTDNNGLLIKVSPASPSYKGQVISFEGHNYPRKAFIGSRFALPPGSFKNQAYIGTVVKITGAGEKAFRVEFEASVAHGAFKDDGTGTETGFIYYNKVRNLFELPGKRRSV